MAELVVCCVATPRGRDCEQVSCNAPRTGLGASATRRPGGRICDQVACPNAPRTMTLSGNLQRPEDGAWSKHHAAPRGRGLEQVTCDAPRTGLGASATRRPGGRGLEQAPRDAMGTNLRSGGLQRPEDGAMSKRHAMLWETGHEQVIHDSHIDSRNLPQGFRESTRYDQASVTRRHCANSLGFSSGRSTARPRGVCS